MTMLCCGVLVPENYDPRLPFGDMNILALRRVDSLYLHVPNASYENGLLFGMVMHYDRAMV